MSDTTAIVKRGSSAVAKQTLTLQEQMDIMEHKFRLPVTMLETHEIEPRDGGRFALVKRETPVKFFDTGDGVKLLQTYSERIGINVPTRRGKYNDEHRLILSSPCSVEVGEVTPVAGVF